MRAVALNDYISIITSDYLEQYVSDGGSTIKVVLADRETRLRFLGLLSQRATRLGYLYASVSAATTRLQKLDELFFSVSRQIDWLASGRRFLKSVLFPRFDFTNDELSTQALARKNNQELWMVQRTVDQLLYNHLVRRKGLSGEFRRAMFSIVGSILSPIGLVANTTPSVLDWLSGRLTSVTLVKPAMLYRRITKTNGRQMLTSMSRWLRDGGLPGLVLAIDVSAVTVTSQLGFDIKYRRSAAVDCFEVIRQFIDSVDSLDGLAVWFVGDWGFVDDDRRGMHIYPALEMRLAEDIHDTNRANPYAPMVRVE